MLTLEKKNRTYPLLSIGTDAKTVKGEKVGIRTGILYLAPHKTAGVGNFCANASKGCIELCLFTAGRAQVHKTVNEGRIRKTHFFVSDRNGFNARMHADLRLMERRALRDGMTPAARLDGTSDIGIGVDFAKDFPGIQFYDYTKNPQRMLRYAKGEFPANYHLTFSRSEDNDAECEEFLKMGMGVAYVFETLPKKYQGYRVIPGDESDARFLDRKTYRIGKKTGYIIGLTPKGKARKSENPFIIPAE